MKTETALLRLLKKLQSLEASRDRLVIAESLVVATQEILDARFALLHVFRSTRQGYAAAPLAWALSGGESAITNLDHFELDEAHLEAEPLLRECAAAPNGITLHKEENGFVMAFAVGPQGCPVAIVEAHCELRPKEELCACVHELLGIYAEHIGLLDYAELDTLTRLNNRKTFDENFERFLGLANQGAQRREDLLLEADGAQRKCWLAVADIDHFKRINDGFGHLFGDEVLIRVADLLRESFRGSDKLFRFGGEEFVILLRFVSADDTRRILDRFREQVETHEFPQVGVVTCSIGYALIDPNLSAAEILGRADNALYYAKNHGRNQVQCYEELCEQGALKPSEPQMPDLQADIDALFK